MTISTSESKRERYQALLPQLAALVDGEDNQTANMANTAAALKATFDFFWVGFYLVEGEGMVLGPFQGPVACTRLKLGKGVCSLAWESKETVIVPDVEAFPGHIACNSASKSEIVIPRIDMHGKVPFVLDVDSDKLNDFNAIDKEFLEQVVALL